MISEYPLKLRDSSNLLRISVSQRRTIAPAAGTRSCRSVHRLRAVLSLFDPSAGTLTPLVPARPRQLRTCTVGTAAGAAGLAELRACVLADVVRRVGEGHGLLVTAWHAAEDGGADRHALELAWGALNVHPLEAVPEPPAGLDLGISAQPGRPGVRWLQPGATRSADGNEVGPAAISGRGLDPLALRLVFLQRRYRDPAELTWEELAAADRTVRDWRALVADWANSPSKPMCAQYTAEVKGAFDDDLDTPAALSAVAALAADQEIPAGSKFESFVSLDHLLGLDLARDIGR